MHENGLGVDKDFTLAFRYYKYLFVYYDKILEFRKATELGYAKAFSKCGDFLYCGKATGGRKDKMEAFKYY